MLKTRGRLLLLVLLSVLAVSTCGCPSVCTCTYGEVGHLNQTMIITNCSHQHLHSLPPGLPHHTQYLDISHNQLEIISANRLDPLKDLRYMDVRGNTKLETLPLMRDKNLTSVYVDHGYVCCIFQIEREKIEGKSDRAVSTAICKPTYPYTECDRNLIHVASFVIYSITVLASIIMNPWVLTVTLAVKERRCDPFTLANVHFSTSNIMITTYAAGMLIVGACFYNKYHYNMEHWLHNPACGALGYILVTASLASTFFYTFEIIVVFLKVKYPFQHTKHMTVTQLNISTAVVWIFSFGIATVPFVNGRYNAVGMCLPFYAGDSNFGFRFVLLYTAITNVATIFNMGLHVYVLKLFISKSKDNTESISDQRRKENRHLRNTVIVTLIFYVLISVSEMIFLIMSCIGGSVGGFGREWWARMVALEAVVNPLTGPMRSKRFFSHTRTLINKVINKHHFHNSIRKSSVGRGALDLQNLRDRSRSFQQGMANGDGSPKHKKLTDSPSLAHIIEHNARGLINGLSSGSEASESPDLPRINISWRSLRSADNKIATISNYRLEKLHSKITGLQSDLAASPISKATLVSDVSDTESEKGIS